MSREERHSSESGSSSEESDGEPIVSMQSGREQRATAGNKMRALLDEELVVEEGFMEEVGDDEFVGNDEKDVFDSDFGSTDEGSGADDDESGEKKLERETKQARRDERSSKKRKTHTPFLPAFARQTKAALKAVASSSKQTLDDDGEPIRPRKKRVVLDPSLITPRESTRKSAVAFKETIQGRLKVDAIRRASQPKQKRKTVKTLSQADLISGALETEEINRASLLAFYAAEEDRREADRLHGMRYEIIGPKVTLTSRTEGGGRDFKGKGRQVEQEHVPTAAEREQIAKDRLESGRRRLIEVIGESGKQGWRASLDVAALAAAGEAERAGKPLVPVASTSKIAEEPSFTVPALTNGLHSSTLPSLPATVQSSTSLLKLLNGDEPVAVNDLPPLPSTIPAPPPPRDDTHTRNYVSLSGWEYEPELEEVMDAYFGEHHVWGSFKAMADELRTPERVKPTCVVTGLPARYREPRTFAPYATADAYDTLRLVADQQFVWNESIRAYTGQVGIGLQHEIESDPKRRKTGRPPAPAQAPPLPILTNGAGPSTATPIPSPSLPSLPASPSPPQKVRIRNKPKPKAGRRSSKSGTPVHSSGGRRDSRGVDDEYEPMDE